MRWPAPDRLSEAAWQRRVIDYAHYHRWLVFHWPDSRRVTEAGWPDLTLVRDSLLFLELKTVSGRLSREQQRVHDRLREAGQNVFVFRPTDWPEVQRLLGTNRHPKGPR